MSKIELAIVRGDTGARAYDLSCDVVSFHDKEVVLRSRTEPSHEIRVRPRYVGGMLGGGEAPTPYGPATICNFSFDGEFVALAYFLVEDDGSFRVIPHDY